MMKQPESLHCLCWPILEVGVTKKHPLKPRKHGGVDPRVLETTTSEGNDKYDMPF